MKAMILAGGLGSRLSEETTVVPKPLVEIGGKPILWHVMKIYAHHGITDFIVCLGYKGHLIREYFLDSYCRYADMTVDLADNSIMVHKSRAEPWRVTLVETGASTMTGGRVKRAAAYLGRDDTFCLTYADGLADVDVGALIKSHHRRGTLATVTAVQTPDRLGRIALRDDRATKFVEKPRNEGEWANGGYFVVQRPAIDLIAGDAEAWEQGAMQRLVADDQLGVHRHTGFWMCMDTQQDRHTLQQLWTSGHAPWKVWSDDHAVPVSLP